MIFLEKYSMIILSIYLIFFYILVCNTTDIIMSLADWKYTYNLKCIVSKKKWKVDKYWFKTDICWQKNNVLLTGG